MQHLVDGDFASNNGGWQWSASTGTDAQPYFRIFNPVQQSKRFDADGVFIHRFMPELKALSGDALHDPSSKMTRSQVRSHGSVNGCARC
jgi:deoxyribodipyrimidine photo-lyase